MREPLGGLADYGPDRLFVDVRLSGDTTRAHRLDALSAAGHPVIQLHMDDRYDLGRQFFGWEMATAVASHVLGVQPFDQPNVESAKVAGRAALATFQETGSLEHDAPPSVSTGAFEVFLNQAEAGDYVSLHVYANSSRDLDGVLERLRIWVRARYRIATTVGYAPRLLHSTGQLHKGDRGNGIFMQLLSESTVDLPIPDDVGGTQSTVSFGVLEQAQALGDAEALRSANRRLARFGLGARPVATLTALVEGLEHSTA